MRFVPYDQLDGRVNVVLDGSPTDGTVLCVTHWPGYPPPEEIADDLSAQMAFRLLDRPELTAGAELVSNNHFDQDGLVSIHALVHPDEALARQALLEDVAFAGDFATYRDRRAARISMVLSASATGRGDVELADDYPTACGMLYEHWVDRLTGLCDDVDRHRDLWADEDATLEATEAAIACGDVTFSERADVELAIVDADVGAPDAGGHRFGGNWHEGLHPMAVHNASARLVVATVRGRHYDVEHRYETWVQLRSRPARRRRDLVPLADVLQDEERGDATWTATPVGALVPRLRSGDGESSIDRARFLDLLTAHLRDAPPAWHPFVPVA